MNSNSFKVVLIGNTGAEKSKIINRLVRSSFAGGVEPTRGASSTYKHFQFDDEQVVLQICDTAGQQYFGLSQMYLRGAHAVGFVYSVSDRSSFESLEEWWDKVQENVEDGVQLMLLGHIINPTNEFERVVSVEEGRKFAYQHGEMPFYEVSAVTGAYIEDSFNKLAEKLWNHHKTDKNEIYSQNIEHLTQNPEKKSISKRIRSWFGRAFTSKKSHADGEKNTGLVAEEQEKMKEPQWVRERPVEVEIPTTEHFEIGTGTYNNVLTPQLQEAHSVENVQKASAPVRRRDIGDWIVDIANYDKIKKIGAGGFGHVFQCRDKSDGSLVAVKYMSSTRESDQQVFEREMENLILLSHRYIVNVRGCCLPCQSTESMFVVISDYISGGSLRSVIDDNPSWFDSTAKSIIIYGIVCGMSHVHMNGVIHRDLKPENVLIDSDNHTPFITDFGSSSCVNAVSLTQQPFCTLCYAAPELLNGGGYDQSIDVYSFGVTLYEIVTGKRFIDSISNKSCFGVCTYICDGNRPAIPENVTQYTRDLIDACWAHDPKSRPSFDQIKEVLEQNLPNLFTDVDIDLLLACK